MLGGLKRDILADGMEEDCFGSTALWTSGVSNVRVELLPSFRDDGEKPFATWIKPFCAPRREEREPGDMPPL